MAKEERGAGKPSIEGLGESILWSSRFLVLVAVAASLLASLMLFALGAVDIVRSFPAFLSYVAGGQAEDTELQLIATVVGAIDTFLIAVVLLVFCFGLYELFISAIDPAKKPGSPSFLIVPSLDALKDKIAKVIVMALMVKFFQIVLTIKVQTITEILMFAASVVLLALSAALLQLRPRHAAKP